MSAFRIEINNFVWCSTALFSYLIPVHVYQVRGKAEHNLIIGNTMISNFIILRNDTVLQYVGQTFTMHADFDVTCGKMSNHKRYLLPAHFESLPHQNGATEEINFLTPKIDYCYEK